MRHMEKNKARDRDMEEVFCLKANQGAPHQERCHTWRERDRPDEEGYG